MLIKKVIHEQKNTLLNNYNPYIDNNDLYKFYNLSAIMNNISEILISFDSERVNDFALNTLYFHHRENLELLHQGS